jgi:endoglucanase
MQAVPSYPLNPYKKLILIMLVAALALVSATPVFAQGSGYWHTSGNQILDSNHQSVRIAGINWYGFETTDKVVHGLWAQDYHTILQSIKSRGYNTIRLPFSNDMIEHPIVPTTALDTNTFNNDLRGLNSLQIMDKIIAGAGALGLRVILDNHRSTAGNSAELNGLWYTSAYPESAWVNDWIALTRRYSGYKDANGNPTVIGLDLRNEPHSTGSGQGACWTGDSSFRAACATRITAQNWPAAAQRAANSILKINPNLLMFVEGVDCYNHDCYWWGGNLEGAARYPVSLKKSGRLVFCAHDFGPNVFPQPWFNSTTTAESLDALRDRFYGSIYNSGTAAVWVGEFGTGNSEADVSDTTAGSQGQWFNSFVLYLDRHSSMNWTYWALNGEDPNGLLDGSYDPMPASVSKQQALAGIQFHLN